MKSKNINDFLSNIWHISQVNCYDDNTTTSPDKFFFL